MNEKKKYSSLLTRVSVPVVFSLVFWAWIGYLFWSFLLEFFAGVYYLNLATLSINSSILFLLFFFVPVLNGFSRVKRFMQGHLLFFYVLPVFFLFVKTGLPYTAVVFLEGVIVAIYLLAFTSHWFSKTTLNAYGGAWALMSGVFLLWVIRYLGLSVNFLFASLPGLITTTIITIILGILEATYYKQQHFKLEEQHEHENEPSPLPSFTQLHLALSFGFTLFITHWLFTSYAVIPRWVGVNPTPTIWITLPVLGLGIILRKAPLLRSAWFKALLLISAVGLAYGHEWLGLLASLPLVFSVPYLWEETLETLHKVNLLTGVLIGMLTYLLSALISVFTVVYDYVPLGHYFRSGEEPLLLVSILIIILSPHLTSLLSTMKNTRISTPKPKINTNELIITGTTLLLAFLLIGINITGLTGMTITYQPEQDFTSLRQAHGIAESVPMFTAMTYNIQQGYDANGKPNLQRVADVIASTGASIIGLQETDTLHISTSNTDVVEWLARRLHMYSYAGPLTRDSSFGNGLLSYYPILEATTIILPSVGENAVLIKALINIQGIHVTVLVAHFGETPDDKQNQAQATANIIQETTGPLILLGDFNVQPGMPQFQTILNAGVTNAYYAIHHYYNTTYPSTSEIIDHIFLKNMTPIQAYVDYNAGITSDHVPVVATLTIP